MTNTNQQTGWPWTALMRRPWLTGVIMLLLLGSATATGWMLGSKESDVIMASETEAHDDEDPGIVTLEPAAQQNIDLKVASATRRRVTQILRTTGSVGPNATRVAHIRPLARGRIERVYVRLGDHIRAGQPLVTYDNIELGERLGEFFQKHATVTVAQRALERAQKLVDIGAISQAEYDRRTAEYANARAGMSNVEEKLHRFGVTDAELDSLIGNTDESLHRHASQSVLRAPFEGTVIDYNVAEGEVVDADRELMTVADLSTVWVQADVYEKDIAMVHEGQTASVTVEGYPDAVFTGTITYVSDLLDPTTRTAKVRCEVPNPDGRLKLEMFATIQIPTPGDRDAVMIPAAAIQQIDDTPAAFVRIDDERFQRRGIQLGVKSNGWVEIVQGVQEGESVVTQGSFYLKSTAMRDKIGGEHGH